jgi:hypothetical protein
MCDSVVGVANRNGRRVRGSDTDGAKVFSCPYLRRQLWCPSTLLNNGYWGSFPGGKAVGTWRSALTFM